MTERDDHIKNAKARALAYIDKKQLPQAIISILSDLEKREDTSVKSDGVLVRMAIDAAVSGDANYVRDYIEGFK